MRLLGRVLQACLILLAFVLLVGFAAQNQALVTVRHFFGAWQAPLVLVILVTLVIGVAAGFGAALGILYKLRRQLSRLQRQVGVAGEEPPAGS